MKVLVTYLSRTGNTKKVAEAMFGEVRSAKEMKRMEDVESVDGYDLFFVGAPVHGLGLPDEEAVAFLKERCQGRKVALFITHGAVEDFPLMQEWTDNCIDAVEGAELVGFFHCQGEIAQEQIDLMARSGDPKLEDWARRAVGSKGQPDESRLERARAFARGVMDNT